MPNVVITDPLFRILYSRLSEELESRVRALASGSALIHGKDIGIDAVATAVNYQKAVSYIEALEQVIELGIQIDHERYQSKDQNGD